MKPTLYYLGKPDDGFGWGVANTNLVRALSKLCNVVLDTGRTSFDGPVFMPVVNHSLQPLRKVKAPRVIGYCFTEWPLTDNARREARQYDVLFAGSQWNADRLRRAGIKRVEALHQGIDCDRFTVKQMPPFVTTDGNPKFVVFSGGKYEYRKGQDYVVAAMRQFMRVHSDTVLLTAWHNQWPQSMASMTKAWLLDDWREPLADLPRERVIQLPPMRNDQCPQVYQQAHIGLFPNRCEAGTNLVMCEFMACGRPVIATAHTGHADVIARDWPYQLTNGTYDPAGWFNCEVSDLIALLEHAYQYRDTLEQRGLECRKMIEPFSWDDCAERIYASAFPGHASQLQALASQ